MGWHHHIVVGTCGQHLVRNPIHQDILGTSEKDKIIYPIRNKSGKTPDLFLLQTLDIMYFCPTIKT